MEPLAQEQPVSPVATATPSPNPPQGVQDSADHKDVKTLDVIVTAKDTGSSSESADDVPNNKDESESTASAPPEQQQLVLALPEGDKQDSEPVITTEQQAKIGKKLLRAMKVLEWEVEDFFDESHSGIPSKIEEQIRALQEIGKQFKLQEEPADDESDDETDDSDAETAYACEVKKLTTDDWPKAYYDDTEPIPVILAVYRNDSATVKGNLNEHVNRTESTRHKQNLHRVVLNNHALCDDLSQAIHIRPYSFPAIIAAPFKLLVRYHAKIPDRLAQLQSDLDEVRKEITQDKSDSTKNTSDGVGADQVGTGGSAPAVLSLTASGVGDEAHGEGESGGEDPQPKGSVVLADGVSERQSQNSSPDPHQESTGTQKRDKQPGTDPSPPEDEAQGRLKRAEDLTTRISYLQLLYDFIKSDLGSYLQVQAEIESGTMEKIAFEDLWYLYKPGEILYAQVDGHDCLYQCYSVTGGQSRKRNFTNEERERRRYLLERENDERNRTEKPFLARQIMAGIGAMTPFVIDCFNMGFNGATLGPVDSVKQINHYSGERLITDLEIYPLRFHKNKEEVVAKLEARGRRITTAYGHMSYNGTTIPLTPSDHQEDISGDIFVDLETYYRAFPHNRLGLGVLRPTEPDPTEDGEYERHETHANNRGMLLLTDREVDFYDWEAFTGSHASILEPTALEFVKDSSKHLQLLSYMLPAYVLRSRKYVHIDIELVEEINKSVEARDSGFEDLVIPDGHRRLLIALVQNHLLSRKAELERGASGSNQHQKGAATQIDIVRGKGRGLIILLHGPPGSGKTSTAETLAAYTQRPLYSITCGDLGTNPSDVERNLVIHTTRAHKWDCLLLLDEADVFVSRRDWRDTERNALVSVFLRQLEYYSGILFLTTNRIGVIDEAFKSRIHVSLRYPSIGLTETLKIWDNILDRIRRDNKKGTDVPIRFDRDALLKYAENHYRRNEATESTWNGRQIRNAFQMAIALGRHEREQRLSDLAGASGGGNGGKKAAAVPSSVKLTVANFRSIAETAREFEEYLVDLRGGHTDSRIAFEESLRYDSHMHTNTSSHHHTTLAAASKDYGTPNSNRGRSEVIGARRRGGASTSFQSENSGSAADGLFLPSSHGAHARSGMAAASPSSGPGARRLASQQVSAGVEEQYFGDSKDEEDDIIEEDLSDGDGDETE